MNLTIRCVSIKYRDNKIFRGKINNILLDDLVVFAMLSVYRQPLC